MDESGDSLDIFITLFLHPPFPPSRGFLRDAIKISTASTHVYCFKRCLSSYSKLSVMCEENVYKEELEVQNNTSVSNWVDMMIKIIYIAALT